MLIECVYLLRSLHLKKYRPWMTLSSTNRFISEMKRLVLDKVSFGPFPFNTQHE